MNIRWPSAFFKSKFWIIFRMPSLAKSVFDKNLLVLSKSSDDRLVFRSRHRKCSVKKYVLRNFAKFAGKHLCQSLCFNKVAGLLAMLLKRRLGHRYFPVSFAKFLGTPFVTEHLRPTVSGCRHSAFFLKPITYLYSKNEGGILHTCFQRMKAEILAISL